MDGYLKYYPSVLEFSRGSVVCISNCECWPRGGDTNGITQLQDLGSLWILCKTTTDDSQLPGARCRFLDVTWQLSSNVKLNFWPCAKYRTKLGCSGNCPPLFCWWLLAGQWPSRQLWFLHHWQEHSTPDQKLDAPVLPLLALFVGCWSVERKVRELYPASDGIGNYTDFQPGAVNSRIWISSRVFKWNWKPIKKLIVTHLRNKLCIALIILKDSSITSARLSLRKQPNIHCTIHTTVLL